MSTPNAPNEIQHSQCRCGVKFMWVAHSNTGRVAPIEEAPYLERPDRRALVVLALTAGGESGTYSVPGRAQRQQLDSPYYVNHWWQCPLRAEWREKMIALERDRERQAGARL